MPARVHSLGKIMIGDDVEIGAASTVARATLESTQIDDGTKIDNHVHIAHNVKIGKGCLICGMAGISGSVTIGDGVVLGGGVGVADHVTIGANAKVAASSGVGTDVAAGTTVSGYPAMPHEKSAEMICIPGGKKRCTNGSQNCKPKSRRWSARNETRKVRFDERRSR